MSTPDDPSQGPGRSDSSTQPAGPIGPAAGPGAGFEQSPTAPDTAQSTYQRRLRDDIDRLRQRHTDLAVEFSENLAPLLEELRLEVTDNLAPGLAALREDTTEQLARHQVQLRMLLRAAEAQQNQPVDWPNLTADDAASEWETLARWVEQLLVPWYEITRDQLPDCWAMHRPVVIELSWLRTARREAYLPSAAAHTAADWHLRWLGPALERVKTLIPASGPRHCAAGEHLTSDQDRALRPPQPPAPGQRVALPHEQLATREHWQGFYDRAVTADLQWRRAREATEQPD